MEAAGLGRHRRYRTRVAAVSAKMLVPARCLILLATWNMLICQLLNH